MANVLIDETIMSAWANTVREKTGIMDTMKPSVLLQKTQNEWGSGGNASTCTVKVADGLGETFTCNYTDNTGQVQTGTATSGIEIGSLFIENEPVENVMCGTIFMLTLTSNTILDEATTVSGGTLLGRYTSNNSRIWVISLDSVQNGGEVVIDVTG